MSYATAPQQRFPHAVFLRRLAGTSSPSSPEGRLGQGALLALRLVDLLAEPPGLYGDAFHYQHLATERFCRALPTNRTDTAHLVGIARSAADAFQERDVRFVLPALLAYAHHLEDELRLHEALDVLDTMIRVGGDGIGPADAIAVRLRMARTFRKLNEFDDAERLYADAGAVAAGAGDRESQLVSRLGAAYTQLGRGNLAAAERSLRKILLDAEASGDRRGQALTHQGLGVVLSTQGRAIDAIPHTWRAFELYEDDEASRTRVLGDLGVMLLTVGDVVGAERALTEVVRRGNTAEVLQNALIELMHCSSYRRDRMGFERWRERCEAERAHMSPNILADFYFKMGVGRARFGQIARAKELLDKALRIAHDAGLHEVVFRIERIKSGLRDCQDELGAPPAAAAEPVIQSDAVREVGASLEQFST